jgi:Bacteriophage tail sheath protein
MSVQVSYPGVYIEEFEPAAPIEGVSTSHAAFIGIAERGPSNVPTLVTSLDDFTRVFGGPVDATVPFYLPISAEGFFRNGGNVLYVLRVSSATNANKAFVCRADPPLPVLTVRAIAEGGAGNGIQVTAVDSSALATALAALPAPGTTLALADPATTAAALDPTRRILTVASSTGFTTGDRVNVKDGNNDRTGLVSAVPDPTTIVLAASLSGNAALAADAPVTLADLDVGDTLLRVEVPTGLNLRQALPAGTLVTIAGAPGETEFATVAAATADAVTLTKGLAEAHVRASAALGSAEFDLTVSATDGVVENFPGLSTSATHPRYWKTVTDSSALVTFERADPLPAGAAPDPRPKADTITLDGAADDDPATSWGTNLPNDINTHLDALARIDDISMVAAPGVTDQGTQQAIVDHCESLFDRFAILDAIKGADLPTVRVQRTTLTGTLDKGFGALYHPWIQLRDPSKKEVVDHPPSGHLAGIYAKIDTTRGVHNAPANIGIATALGVSERLTDADQSVVNLEGVNLIRILPGRGVPVVWGARTTTGDRNWQYINIRRLFLFLEESIQEGLRPNVFLPNDLALWERVKRTLNEFLTRVWRDGALFGATAKEAFYVRIDEALNPPSTRKLGRLNIEIGVQPVYPAEFIVVRIGIWDGGSEVTEN